MSKIVSSGYIFKLLKLTMFDSLQKKKFSRVNIREVIKQNIFYHSFSESQGRI